MPDLKELLGDAYKEGMTFDEASAALKERKIVDLATGEYVGKKKYEDAIAERDTARRERDDATAKVKDYDELVKYRDEAEAAKANQALAEKLTKYGVKPDMVEFIRFQIESGKIERGEEDKKLEESVKKFLKENPQYASEDDTQKKPNQKNPRINTSGSGDGTETNGGRTPAKVVISQPWNRHKML